MANATVRASHAGLLDHTGLAGCCYLGPCHRHGCLGPRRKHRHSRQEHCRPGGYQQKLRHIALPDFAEWKDYAVVDLPEIGTTPQHQGEETRVGGTS